MLDHAIIQGASETRMLRAYVLLTTLSHGELERLRNNKGHGRGMRYAGFWDAPNQPTTAAGGIAPCTTSGDGITVIR